MAVLYTKENAQKLWADLLEKNLYGLVADLAPIACNFAAQMRARNVLDDDELDLVVKTCTRSEQALKLISIIKKKTNFWEPFLQCLQEHGLTDSVNVLEKELRAISVPEQALEKTASEQVDASLALESATKLRYKLAHYFMHHYCTIATFANLEPVNVSDIFVQLMFEDTSEKSFLPFKTDSKFLDYKQVIGMFVNPPDPLTSGKRSRLLLVSGDPGCGKTTFIKKLCYDWATTVVPSPDCTDVTPDVFGSVFLLFAISLRGVKDKHKTLLDLLSTELMLNGVELNRNDLSLIQFWLKNNPERFLVLFDGFDELLSTDICTELSNVLFKAPNWISPFRLVLTSRPYALQNVRAPLRIKVAPLPKKSIKDFVQKYCSNNVATSELLVHLKKDFFFKQLASSPLLLLMFCVSIESSFALPSTVAELYHESCRWLFLKYGERTGNFFTDGEITDWVETALAQNMAHLAFDNEVGGILLFQDMIMREHSVGFEALEIGLLVVDTDLNGRRKHYQFVHKTFQEYFASIHCQTNIASVLAEGRFVDYMQKKSSNSFLVFLVGLCEDSLQFFQHVNWASKQLGSAAILRLIKDSLASSTKQFIMDIMQRELQSWNFYLFDNKGSSAQTALELSALMACGAPANSSDSQALILETPYNTYLVIKLCDIQDSREQVLMVYELSVVALDVNKELLQCISKQFVGKGDQLSCTWIRQNKINTFYFDGTSLALFCFILCFDRIEAVTCILILWSGPTDFNTAYKSSKLAIHMSEIEDIKLAFSCNIKRLFTQFLRIVGVPDIFVWSELGSSLHFSGAGAWFHFDYAKLDLELQFLYHCYSMCPSLEHDVGIFTSENPINFVEFTDTNPCNASAVLKLCFHNANVSKLTLNDCEITGVDWLRTLQLKVSELEIICRNDCPISFSFQDNAIDIAHELAVKRLSVRESASPLCHFFKRMPELSNVAVIFFSDCQKITDEDVCYLAEQLDHFVSLRLVYFQGESAINEKTKLKLFNQNFKNASDANVGLMFHPEIMIDCISFQMGRGIENAINLGKSLNCDAKILSHKSFSYVLTHCVSQYGGFKLIIGLHEQVTNEELPYLQDLEVANKGQNLINLCELTGLDDGFRAKAYNSFTTPVRVSQILIANVYCTGKGLAALLESLEVKAESIVLNLKESAIYTCTAAPAFPSECNMDVEFIAKRMRTSKLAMKFYGVIDKISFCEIRSRLCATAVFKDLEFVFESTSDEALTYVLCNWIEVFQPKVCSISSLCLQNVAFSSSSSISHPLQATCSKLRIERCSVTSSVAIVAMLSLLNITEVLVVCNNDPSSCMEISKALQHTSITNLVIVDCSCSAKTSRLDKMLDNLKNVTSLLVLRFKRCRLDDSHVLQICDAVKEMNAVEEVHLEENIVPLPLLVKSVVNGSGNIVKVKVGQS